MSSYNKINEGLFKTVKGLNIATIVLATISILIAIVSLVYLIIAYQTAQSGNLVNEIARHSEMAEQTYIKGDDLIIGNSKTNILQLTNIGLNLMLAFSSFALIASAFSLFVAIFTLVRICAQRNTNQYFYLNIISSVTSFLSLNFVRFILVVLSSIFIYRTTIAKRNPKH